VTNFVNVLSGYEKTREKEVFLCLKRCVAAKEFCRLRNRQREKLRVPQGGFMEWYCLE
jgi:hypothetical protein